MVPIIKDRKNKDQARMISYRQLFPMVLNRIQNQDCGPIGITLTREKIHLLQLEKKKNSLRIQANVSIPYPGNRAELLASPAEFSICIHKALRSGAFRGKNIVSCLPNKGTKIINLSYQMQGDVNEDEVIVAEVMNCLDGNPTEYVIDYMPIRTENKDTNTRTALVAVARREKVISYLELFGKANLTVQALDIGPAALLRLVVSLNGPEEFPLVMLINFGRDKSYLTVIDGRRLIMDRELDFGENLLIHQLGKQLDMTEKQALKVLQQYGFSKPYGVGSAADQAPSDEILSSMVEILHPLFLEFIDNINKTLIYTASMLHGKSVQQIYLLGSLARHLWADRFLAQMLALPVAILNPFSLFAESGEQTPSVNSNITAGTVLTTGLALRGLVNE
jgi:type IV pilus assembly protein PilM